MSSRSDHFECRWQRSRALLLAYLSAQLLALISLYCLNIPASAASLGVLVCLLHGFHCLPKSVLLNDDRAFTQLRRDDGGWQLWNHEQGWQPVQLRPDSLALPHMVVLRFRLMKGGWWGRRWVRSLCIPSDSMAPDAHRRLRLRLKFTRRRWAAPE
ncbi:protein YgfX [Pseudomonas sp. UBA1879]|uniref:protein YgfX n=1 Tax=Pseudomonas sp. UBA1879 TaxID=1947305 RepID=UPI0025E0A927|nr:protein YgfX [Pseudomonas sp. UBA1879]